jgi:hypothetical protein
MPTGPEPLIEDESGTLGSLDYGGGTGEANHRRIRPSFKGAGNFDPSPN